MRITKKIKKDFEATRDFWKWLSETGAKRKADWEGFTYELYTLRNHCAFCEYFPMCLECPLANQLKAPFNHDPCVYPAYHRWERAETAETRKKYALLLYEAIDNWCKENL